MYLKVSSNYLFHTFQQDTLRVLHSCFVNSKIQKGLQIEYRPFLQHAVFLVDGIHQVGLLNQFEGKDFEQLDRDQIMLIVAESMLSSHIPFLPSKKDENKLNRTLEK